MSSLTRVSCAKDLRSSEVPQLEALANCLDEEIAAHMEYRYDDALFLNVMCAVQVANEVAASRILTAL